MQSICVLGLGYVGLPTAALFALHGKQVVGVDVDPEVLEAIRAGRVPHREPGLAALVDAALGSGRLSVEAAPVQADAFILAVPTPLGPDNCPDLSCVVAAAESIVPVLVAGNLVILESTSPIGTTSSLVPILELSGLNVGRDLLLAYSPERVLPSRVLEEMVRNDRVIGGLTRQAALAARDLYRTFATGEILLTDAATAELVKLMENISRDVNIALANEFSRVAETVGVDVHDAIRLANRHPRVDILKPGPGVGGHCVAVDPWFLAHAAPEHTRLIQTARRVNDDQPAHVAQVILDELSDLADPVVAVLGLTYKADVGDLRESPALRVVEHLARHLCHVRLHDALAGRLADGTRVDGDLADLLTGADALVILTDHADYRALSPQSPVLAGMRGRRVIDTRNCIDGARWAKTGFSVRELGSGHRARAAVPA